jgi:hypothetical protein
MYVATAQWEDAQLFTFEQKVLILKDSFLVPFPFSAHQWGQSPEILQDQVILHEILSATQDPWP